MRKRNKQTHKTTKQQNLSHSEAEREDFSKGTGRQDTELQKTLLNNINQNRVTLPEHQTHGSGNGTKDPKMTPPVTATWAFSEGTKNTREAGAICQ